MTTPAPLLVFALAVGGCTSCTHTGGVSAATIADVLEGAGCIAATPDVPGAIAEELDSGAAPTWLTCLQAGGTVASCAVPCAPPDAGAP